MTTANPRPDRKELESVLGDCALLLWAHSQCPGPSRKSKKLANAVGAITKAVGVARAVRTENGAIETYRLLEERLRDVFTIVAARGCPVDWERPKWADAWAGVSRPDDVATGLREAYEDYLRSGATMDSARPLTDSLLEPATLDTDGVAALGGPADAGRIVADYLHGGPIPIHGAVKAPGNSARYRRQFEGRFEGGTGQFFDVPMDWQDLQEFVSAALWKTAPFEELLKRYAARTRAEE